MYQAAVFDLDGTLVATPKLYRQAWIEVSAKYGYSFAPELYFQILGRSAEVTRQLLLTLFGDNYPLDKINAERLEFVRSLLPTQNILKEGAEELLQDYKEKGIKMAVATSSSTAWAKELLQHHNILPYFDVIIGADSVKNHKPSPEAYLLALSYLGSPAEQTLIFEDSEAGIMAAHASNCVVIAIPDLLPLSPETLKLSKYVFRSLDQATIANLKKCQTLKPHHLS